MEIGMDNQTKSLGVVNQSPPIKRKSRRPQSSSAEEFGRFLRAIWDSNWLRLILVVWFILWATGVTEKISKHFRTPRQSSLVAEQKLMHQDAMRRADRLPLYLYRQFDESAKALDPSKPSSEANLAEDGTGNSESTTYESGEVEVYDDSEDQL
ncbi:MAG: hypothetical protein NT091_04580, partial [Candidatus Falkowbacteria bacterium]|nr:hypothetical protein [Candidatus Falkowbacteria bacterium]